MDLLMLSQPAFSDEVAEQQNREDGFMSQVEREFVRQLERVSQPCLELTRRRRVRLLGCCPPELGHHRSMV